MEISVMRDAGDATQNKGKSISYSQIHFRGTGRGKAGKKKVSRSKTGMYKSK